LKDLTDTPGKQPVTGGPGYFEVIVLALLTTILVVMGYDRLFAQKIKVVDLKGYLRTQKALLAAGEINQQEWTNGLNSLERLLNEEAASHGHHVILMKEVVLRNGDELRIHE